MQTNNSICSSNHWLMFPRFPRSDTTWHLWSFTFFSTNKTTTTTTTTNKNVYYYYCYCCNCDDYYCYCLRLLNVVVAVVVVVVVAVAVVVVVAVVTTTVLVACTATQDTNATKANLFCFSVFRHYQQPIYCWHTTSGGYIVVGKSLFLLSCLALPCFAL